MLPSPHGRPSSRMVLCKGLSAEGLDFFTNYSSRKGEELAGQPLVALWRVDVLRGAASRALQDGALSVRDLQATLRMPGVRLAGVRFGNLNTPADLARAGVA